MHADVFVAERLWTHRQAELARDIGRRRVVAVRTPGGWAAARGPSRTMRRLVGLVPRFAAGRRTRPA